MRQPNNPNSLLQLGAAISASARDVLHYARRIEIAAIGRGTDDSDLDLLGAARIAANAGAMLQSLASALLGEAYRNETLTASLEASPPRTEEQQDQESTGGHR
jgi:hypothetical protein